MRPPKSAWEELDGRPSSQVSRFQRMAPTSAAKIDSGRDALFVDDPAGDRLGDLDRQERPDEVEHGGHGHRDPWA